MRACIRHIVVLVSVAWARSGCIFVQHACDATKLGEHAGSILTFRVRMQRQSAMQRRKLLHKVGMDRLPASDALAPCLYAFVPPVTDNVGTNRRPASEVRGGTMM